jgi:streptogramin lyase
MRKPRRRVQRRSRLIIIIFLSIAITGTILASVTVYLLIPRSTVGSPTSPYITEYNLTTKDASPNGITQGPNGLIWFCEENVSKIAAFSPSNHSFTEYTIPNPPSAGLQVWNMVFDSKGNLWFGDLSTNAIWEFFPGNATFHKFALPTKGAGPLDVALDNQDNIWFSEDFAGKIGEISATTHAIQEFPLPIANSTPVGLYYENRTGLLWTVDPASENIWFFNPANEQFGKLNLTTPLFSPVGITIDNSGGIWLTQHGASFLSEINRTTGTVINYPTSALGSQETTLPYWVQTDSHGDLWFNEHIGNKIAMLNPTNLTLTEYVIPTHIVSYGNISGALTFTIAKDGKVWFTELFGDKIGVVNPYVKLPYYLKLTSQQLSVTPGHSNSTTANLVISTQPSSSSSTTTTESTSGKIYFSFADTEQNNALPSNLTMRANPSSVQFSDQAVDIIVSTTIQKTAAYVVGVSASSEWVVYTAYLMVTT